MSDASHATASADPEYSVVVPTRGDSRHLRAALESALSQADRIEVLLVHDRRGGSPIADEPRRDPRIRVLESTAPGPAAARNVGLSAARGRFVALLDDDDAWLPGHLARARERLDADGRLLMSCADAYLLRDRTGDASAALPLDPGGLPRFRPDGASRVLSLRDLLLANWVLTPTVVLRRAELRPTDRFREDLSVMEDYDLWLGLVRRGRIWFEAVPAAIVRKRPGSASGDRRRMAECALRVLEDQIARGVPEDAWTGVELRRRLGRLWHDRAHACLVEGDRGEAARSARRSLAHLPLLAKNYIYLVVAALPARLGAGLLRGARTVRGRAGGGGEA